MQFHDNSLAFIAAITMTTANMTGNELFRMEIHVPLGYEVTLVIHFLTHGFCEVCICNDLHTEIWL